MGLDVRGKRVVVVGLGASGAAACRLLVSRGARVVANDTRLDVAKIEGAEMILGGHAEASLEAADLVVISPGVPSFAALEAAAEKGIPIWGEVELATRALEQPGRLVAIGGTNGKSTVTSLVGAMLEARGLVTFVGGNLGEPLAAHADERFDAVVLEVSSFQMERVETFHPDVSVLLNVTPDHLDRYPDLGAYARAKGNAFIQQTPSDTAVIPAGDAPCLEQARRGRGRIATFGAGASTGVVDVAVTPDAIVDRSACAEYARARIRLQGGHNALNVAAAIAAVRPFALAPELIREVLARFEGLPHRMALVGEHQGIRFYDDSKGTNVGASVTAVRGSVESKVVLIAGGRDKGGSYEPLVLALRERGRAAVLIGEAATIIEAAIGGVVPTRRAASMLEAVRTAADLARDGDAVLLSPACSSFDMFRDYKHRGDVFVSAVRALIGGPS